MKRLYIYILLIIFGIQGYAQTQQGYVKTRGRLSSTGQLIPGVRLQGATISVKNGGSYVSANNGAFAFAVPSQSYYLTNVQKKDYQLCDRDVLGKSLKYSSNPLVVVMDTPDQILEDRLESEEKIRATLTTQLNQKKAELKQLKEQQKISQQEYNKLLQELYALQNNNEKLISEMAERYSTLDFEEMDEFQRTVSYLIQNGELTKADSLLRTKDVKKLGDELDQMDVVIQADAEEISKRQTAHEQAVELKSKKLEEFASLCYSNFEICKLQHKNDSAAFWLELRASKDTMNIKWQLEVGEFLQIFVANHNLALQYYERALHNALLLYDLNNEVIATCYNNIATILQYKDDFSGALDFHLKALDIRLSLFSEDHPSVALSFYNLGIVYKEKGDYIKAIENYKKALSIWENIEDYNRYKCAYAYNEIGAILHKQGNDNEAVIFHRRAIEILSSMDKLTDEQQIELAVSYDEIGCVYRELGNNEKGLESHSIALSMLLKIFDECTPHVATVYNNLGNTYDSLGESQKAIEFLRKALDIWSVLLGEEHSYVGICYSNIAWSYRTLGDNKKALECHQKALHIFQRCYEENHPNLANVYNNIGYDYHLLGDIPNALYYNRKALTLYRNTYGENHQYTVNLYEVIGNIFIEASNKNFILDDSQEYFSNLIYLGSTIADSSSPAKKNGMDGDYIILSLENWNLDSSTFLTTSIGELRGKPKTVTVMKDGVISQFHFEDSLGLNITLKCVGKEEKQRIIEAYHKWLKKNKKKKR